MSKIPAWRFGPEGWSRTEVPEALIECSALTVAGDEFGASIESLHWPMEQDRAFWVSTDASGASLVLVDKDDLPSQLRLLNELQGLLDVFKVRELEQQSQTMRRDFRHRHGHDADTICRICDPWQWAENKRTAA